MEKNNINLILAEMKHIMNVAIIMDMFFKPFEEFRQEKNILSKKQSKQKIHNSITYKNMEHSQ